MKQNSRFIAGAHAAETPKQMAAWFEEPPMQYRSRPLYWLNAPLDRTLLRDHIQAMRDQCGFGGFAPVTVSSVRPEYMTDEYFAHYGLMLEMAEKLGLKAIFYDDINFPSGTADGRLAKQHPDSMLKNLRKLEQEVSGPQTVELQIPKGTLMAAVAMEAQTKQRLDLAGFIRDGALRNPWR